MNTMKLDGKNDFISILLFLLVCAAAGCFSGCASMKNAGDTDSALRGRVEKFWQHKIKGEFAECYLFEDPDYREKVSMTNYVKGLSSGGIIWFEVSVKDISIEGDSARAFMNMRYLPFGMFGLPKEGIKRDFTECWRLVKGVWYHMRDCPEKKQ